MCIRDSHPTRGDRDAPHLTERRWWPPLGRSHGHQRAVFMTATGQFLLALDSRARHSCRCRFPSSAGADGRTGYPCRQRVLATVWQRVSPRRRLPRFAPWEAGSRSVTGTTRGGGERWPHAPQAVGLTETVRGALVIIVVRQGCSGSATRRPSLRPMDLLDLAGASSSMEWRSRRDRCRRVVVVSSSWARPSAGL